MVLKNSELQNYKMVFVVKWCLAKMGKSGEKRFYFGFPIRLKSAMRVSFKERLEL